MSRLYHQRDAQYALFTRCLCLFLLLSAPLLRAQPESLITIHQIIVKPEAAQAWDNLQREVAIPALRESGYEWVEVWRAGGAGNAFYRSILSPLEDLSQLDQMAVFERVLGGEGARELMERHRSMVDSINILIVRPRPDLSFGESPQEPGIGVLTNVTVASGRAEEFERRLRTQVASELRESNVSSFQVGQVVYGGQINQYSTLLDFPSTSDDNAPQRGSTESSGHPTPMEWALGPVGVARIAAEENSPITSIERIILRYDASLSSP